MKTKNKAARPRASKGAIVVIEDNGATLDFLKEALIHLGYTPLLAEEGGKGVELCRREDVRLVLTDYYLPLMSGVEVAQKVKALPHPLPVVLTSASYNEPERDLFDKGVDYFLNKPFGLKDLELILEEALHSKA